jgi:hypothetical protein
VGDDFVETHLVDHFAVSEVLFDLEEPEVGRGIDEYWNRLELLSVLFCSWRGRSCGCFVRVV